MTWRRSVAVALAAGLVVVAAAGRSRGADERTGEAPPIGVLIRDAVAEYDAGHFEEARALFRSAHERAPSARALRGMGMCSFELRDYVDAARLMTAALAEQRRPLTTEQRRHAESLLARAYSFIGRIALRLDPPGASLFVDGRPAGIEADGNLLLPFGHHVVALRCSSCDPAEKKVDVDVAGGEKRTLEIALAPTQISMDRATTSDTPVLTSPPKGSDVDGTRSKVHLWIGGAAAAAALGAAASAMWWRDRQNELDVCNQATGPQDVCRGQSTVETERRVAIGLTLGLGAAALAGGVAAAILWRRDRPGAATIACAPQRGLGSCAIVF